MSCERACRIDLVDAQGAGAAVVESEGVDGHGMTERPDQRAGAIWRHEIAFPEPFAPG
jgi:hypothetical protein